MDTVNQLTKSSAEYGVAVVVMFVLLVVVLYGGYRLITSIMAKNDSLQTDLVKIIQAQAVNEERSNAALENNNQILQKICQVLTYCEHRNKNNQQ